MHQSSLSSHFVSMSTTCSPSRSAAAAAGRRRASRRGRRPYACAADSPVSSDASATWFFPFFFAK